MKEELVLSPLQMNMWFREVNWCAQYPTLIKWQSCKPDSSALCRAALITVTSKLRKGKTLWVQFPILPITNWNLVPITKNFWDSFPLEKLK